MVELKSNTDSLGMEAPDFELPGVDGETYSLDSFDDKQLLVVMFICNHCPYVKAVRQRLIDLANEYQDKGVGFVGINPNDAEEYPDDSFENMKKIADEYDFPFAYLRDESQDVAAAYDAVCTPDIYLFDENRTLKYRGRIDDNWKEPAEVTQRNLKNALDTLLAGDEPDEDQKPSVGCSIKWKE